ncbi:vomeronasal type-2 receptor 26-like [Pelodytes ibericus]
MTCSVHVSELEGMIQPGDIIIGLIIPIHLDYAYKPASFTEHPPRITCTRFSYDSYQQLQAAILAVQEINMNPQILPNLTLGLQAYDSCVILQKTMDAVFQVLTGHTSAIPNYRCLGGVPLSAVISHSASTHSILLAHILGLYRYPQVPLSVCSQSCLPGFWKAVKSGEPVCCFQCVPCPQGEISNQTDSVGCFKCPWDKWPHPQKSTCLPKSLKYLSYEDALGTTLAAVSIVSSLVPACILRLFIQHKSTPVVKANNYSLSCLLLVSLSLCFLCALAFIGYPQPEMCLLRQATFGMVFALCISCILSKTIMVVCAFMATKPGSSLRKWANPRVSYTIVFFFSFLQFLLCITWLSLFPPFPEQNTQTSFIIVECNEGSQVAFWCMLGYLGLLANISFIVAFLAQRLPDRFNEAKFITFSMLAFLTVWLSYIPASLSAQGKYTVTMEIFAILSSSWVLLFCMFLPKCYIILFRPYMNSREHLMRKDRDQSDIVK